MQIERPPRWTKFSIPLQQAGVRKYDCVKARYFRLPKNINTGSNVYINSVKSSFRLHTLVLIQKENSLISLSKSYNGRYIYKIFCSLVTSEQCLYWFLRSKSNYTHSEALKFKFSTYLKYIFLFLFQKRISPTSIAVLFTSIHCKYL